MESLGIRELRANLAAAARRAGAGERVVITVDGEPVAQLGPVEPTDAELTIHDQYINMGPALAPYPELVQWAEAAARAADVQAMLANPPNGAGPQAPAREG